MRRLKNISAVIITLLFTSVITAQTTGTTVFESGTEGHKIYRIPAIVGLPNKTLLAFCEGRVNGSGDFGDINIVLKKSTDGGATWSALSTVIDYNNLQAGNPAPVVDLTDPRYPAGRIFLFYNTGNNDEYSMRMGKGIREVWYVTSTDEGATWSAPINITAQVHRPNQPGVNKAYSFKEDWRSYANTPGHATQFLSGVYKGRIYVAANHSSGLPQKNFEDYNAHAFYTDNHGESFSLANSIILPGSNEATAAPLSNGKLILNARNQAGTVRYRYVAYSNDGGASWQENYFDTSLVDPVCEGSILEIGQKKGKTILAFCNAADAKKRDNLTLRISYDEGKNWTNNTTKNKAIVIAKAPENYKGDYAAYSDLVVLDAKRIGVLYEKENYSKIVFTVCSWK
jgi:sialidase-1